jgi:hypothetical protein
VDTLKGILTKQKRMIKMRKLSITSSNTEIDVNGWNVYVNGEAVENIIKDNMELGRFRAKISIIIEEISDEFIVDSNKSLIKHEKELELDEE